MPSFSTITELSNYLKKTLFEINRNEIRKEAEKQYRKAILDTVYANPTQWATGSFLESVNSKVVRQTKHSSLISVFPDAKLMFNTYPSWKPETYGNNHQKEIGWWLEKGHGGMATVKGRYFYRLVMTEYFNQRVYKQTFIQALAKRGIQAS